MSWKGTLYSAVGEFGDIAENYLRGKAIGWMNSRFGPERDGRINYISPSSYKNVFVFTATRAARNLAARELKSMPGRIIDYYRNKKIDELRQKQLEEKTNLVSLRLGQTGDYEALELDGIVFDCKSLLTGKSVAEGLLMGYEGKEEIELTRIRYNPVTKENEETCVRTVAVAIADPGATVQVTSQKNILMTQVVGRDFSRKELLSGGDYIINISGSMVSSKPGVYPAAEVKKLMNIATYDGVLQVRNMILSQLNITQVIITNFTLEQQTYLNVQPYSMSCVAIEPDTDVMLEKDTIEEINRTIEESAPSKWYKVMLKERMGSAVKSADFVAGQTIDTASGLLDGLLNKII